MGSGRVLMVADVVGTRNMDFPYVKKRSGGMKGGREKVGDMGVNAKSTAGKNWHYS